MTLEQADLVFAQIVGLGLMSRESLLGHIAEIEKVCDKSNDDARILAAEIVAFRLEKSLGHLMWLSGYEYFVYGRNVYRAHNTSVVDTTGKRCGRFVCSVLQWDKYKEVNLS